VKLFQDSIPKFLKVTILLFKKSDFCNRTSPFFEHTTANLNYRSGDVARGFSLMVFCHPLFAAFLAASLVKCMRMNIRIF